MKLSCLPQWVGKFKGEFSKWCKSVTPVLISMLSISGVLTTQAESYVIQFDENDYQIITGDNGLVHISKTDGLTAYPGYDEPALPLSSFNIAIEGNKELVTSVPTFSKRLVKTNVVMARILPQMLNDTLLDLTSSDYTYSNTVYPFSNCELTNVSEWTNIKILHYMICPFVYDASKNELYFIDSIKLDLTTREDAGGSLAKRNSLTVKDGGDLPSHIDNYYTDSDIIKSIVSNPEEVDAILSSTQSGWPSGPRIDYVVVTTQALKEAFEPLINWKHAKGLYAKIVTIEEIEKKFQGYETQFAIKSYLYELYHINSLKYVLLGGDDTVVPVRRCYSQGDPITFDFTIPTDMYYACFSGDFTWDGNNNGIYGELDDNVSIAQSIYLTRLPVRTQTDVEAYVGKLIAYEKNPKWSNKLLFCGNRLNTKEEAVQSDAERRGEVLYSNFIEKYWQGERYRLFDTCSDFPGGADYDFSAANLSEQLAQGYAFVDIGTHGSQTAMKMENDPNYKNTYNSKLGAEQVNNGFSIITFVGCLTNAFDTAVRRCEDGWRQIGSCLEDPCLSESLIRNPTSGVVAYLGCSREIREVGLTPPDYDTSTQYITYFYKSLFEPDIEEKNYGRIVAAAKAKNKSCSKYDGFGRWTQFGLNPVGDPEMPIYINEPKTFDEVSVDFGRNNIVINTGVPGCRVCLMSREDNGQSYYRVFEDVQQVSVLEAAPDVSICITKQGYMPKTYGLLSVEQQELINSIVKCTEINPSGVYNISLQLDDNAVSPQLFVADLNGNVERVIEVDCSNLTLDLSPLHSGLHILSLLVDGKMSDFCRIIIE